MLEYLLIAAVIIIILLHPKYDPAIKLKEFNEAWAKRLRGDRDDRP